EHADVKVERLLDLDAVDVLAAGDDHVLRSVDEVEESAVVQVSEVAGVVPAAGQRRRRRLGLVPVAGHHVVATDRNLTDGPGGGWLAGLARSIEYCDLDSHCRLATGTGLGLLEDELLVRQHGRNR